MTGQRAGAGRFAKDLVGVAGAALLGLALAKELARPVDQRTWNGTVVGIPYDLRPPTLARVRQRWWNPAEPRILTPHVFGVGWSVNLGRLVSLLRRGGR